MQQILRNFFEEFTFKHIKQDLSASLAVFLVAVPLCLGIAHASNAPLLSGLITGIIGGVVVGALSKSPISVSGPAAGLTAIMATAAMQLQDFRALLVATVLAGLIQIMLGLIKAGGISSYIPAAVIRGMLSAIGLILILKQLPHLMGHDVEDEGATSFSVKEHIGVELAHESHAGGHEGIGNTFSVIGEAIQSIPNQIHIFLIGLLAIALIIGWDKTLGKKIKTIPSSLVAVVIGTLLTLAYGLFNQNLVLGASHLVQLPVIKSLGDFIEQSQFPLWAALSNPQVYVVAITLAFVASIETLLCIEATDKMDPHRRWTPKNRELIAQGTGNALCGLTGGIPMTSVIVRSSVNMQAGGMTKLSAIFHGIWMLLAVLLAAPIINLIPLSALAAVLIVTGYKLANPKQFKMIYKQGFDQFIPYMATIVAVILTDLLIGVIFGICVSVIFILFNYYKADVIKIEDLGTSKKLVFAESLTFLNKGHILEILESIPAGSRVILDTSNCQYIDHDIVEAIQEFTASAEERKLEIVSNTPAQTTNSSMRTQRLNLLMEDPQANAH